MRVAVRCCVKRKAAVRGEREKDNMSRICDVAAKKNQFALGN